MSSPGSRGGSFRDPAGLCGEIQPDLDRVAVRARMLEAADLAARALAAEGNGADDRAVRLWHATRPDLPPRAGHDQRIG
jgi:hypothetical protein